MPRVRFDDSYDANPAKNYERFFVPAIGKPLAQDLIQRAGVESTDRVLDVACGTGIVIRLISDIVETPVALAGLDPNGAMLAVARTTSPAAAEIQWHQAPAEHMPLASDTFDVVLCQMGLQFMASQAGALAEMYRVMTHGGRLFLSVPGPVSGAFAALAEVLERHVGTDAAQFIRQVFSLHEVEVLEMSLRDAGFVKVDVEPTTRRLHLPAPEAFLWQYLHSTPLAGVMSEMEAEKLAAIEHDVIKAWTAFASHDGLVHDLRLVVASGSKPAA